MLPGVRVTGGLLPARYVGGAALSSALVRTPLAASGPRWQTGRVNTITPVLGDITQQNVDAIVNAANNAMRGGGGVDGAIHRAGGPAILRDCIARFPHGLETGDAGWTTAGELQARWVIHTVGPNYAAGQRDRALLLRCYRRCLEVADELGAHSIAFPLISAGVYGWPREDAIAVAIEAITGTPTHLDEVRLVAFSRDTHDAVLQQLSG
ncbi:O-acetyl-ADP-ribose deacetylase [Microterricola pindariensis]|uniref:O-acetyl-ADP-ribose deacetylase n=1 Tax=Microterricola pindariensis TaxID=478010 RepID=UPI002678BD72|nr:O-acetyl-ADP-ribose deacetylase [Microterricola pindariensis]